MTARAAVQVENVLSEFGVEKITRAILLTSQHPRPNNQAHYFVNQPLSLFKDGFLLGKL
jgi:hypothetical protein